MHAELAYLFRHAMVRDAAYELQTPGARADLHGLALHLLEEVMGGPPPWPEPGINDHMQLQPHALDAIADEMAQHAARAQHSERADLPALRERELHYTWRAAEFASQRCQIARAIELFQAMSTHPALPAVLKPRATREAGWLLFTVGQHARGRELVGSALQVATESGLRLERGRCLGVMGTLLMEMGESAEAEGYLHQALEWLRELGDRANEARTLTYLANVVGRLGRNTEAEGFYRNALQLMRDVGDRRGEGMVLANLATMLDRDGHPDALQTYRQALAIQREVGNRRIEGIVLSNLASHVDEAGNHAEAETLFMQAIAVHREYGNKRSEGFALGNLASLYASTARHELAEQAFQQALEIHRQQRARWSIAVHTCDYGVFKIQQGRPDARETWCEGATILRDMGDTTELATKTSKMQQACTEAGVAPFSIE